MAVICPFCSMTLTAGETAAGVCGSCGKRIPDGVTTSIEPASASPGSPGSRMLDLPKADSWWTTPVVPKDWPAVRWLAQLLSAMIFVVSCGGSVTILPLVVPEPNVRFAYIFMFGIPFGLCLAAALNGFSVGRSYRRLTVLSVFAIMAGALGYAYVFYLLGGLIR